MNNINILYEQVLHQGGSGNTTWIMDAAKKNPNCKILFGSNYLAKFKEMEYKEWFINEHKREPKSGEMPRFVGVGGALLNGTTPLILDNSVIDMLDIQSFMKDHYNKGWVSAHELMEADYRVNARMAVADIKRKAILYIVNRWYIKWNSRWVKNIEEYINFIKIS